MYVVAIGLENGHNNFLMKLVMSITDHNVISNALMPVIDDGVN